MTYTTKKTLANFLSNEDGLLSKSFINMLTLFYGQNAGREAFISTLKVGNRYSIRDGYYVVLPMQDERRHSEIRDTSAGWFPGEISHIGTTKSFVIFRCRRYGRTYHTRPAPSVGRLLTDRFTEVLPELTGVQREAYQLLLWDRLYDMVAAPDYTEPADDTAVAAQIESILNSEPMFSRETWNNISIENPVFGRVSAALSCL